MGGHGMGGGGGQFGGMMRSMRRDDSVTQQKVTKGTTRRMFRFAKPYRRILGWFLVLVIIDAVIGVVNPLLFRSIIDKGIPEHDKGLIIGLAAVAAVLAIIDTGLSIGIRYVSAKVGEGLIFDIMGFGRPIDDVPMILQPGVMTMAWGSVVRQLAAGLDVELDSLDEWYERLPATETFEVDSGTIEKGTAAALHFELRGMRNGKAVIVLEHITRLHDDLAPEWPQPAGHGCYRVTITGEPNYTLDLQLLGTDGDHNTAGLKATAMRLVNSVPAVVEGAPGLLTALDLPPVYGRGLVA